MQYLVLMCHDDCYESPIFFNPVRSLLFYKLYDKVDLSIIDEIRFHYKIMREDGTPDLNFASFSCFGVSIFLFTNVSYYNNWSVRKS